MALRGTVVPPREFCRYGIIVMPPLELSLLACVSLVLGTLCAARVRRCTGGVAREGVEQA